jgi:hypothetical protein
MLALFLQIYECFKELINDISFIDISKCYYKFLAAIFNNGIIVTHSQGVTQSNGKKNILFYYNSRHI